MKTGHVKVYFKIDIDELRKLTNRKLDFERYCDMMETKYGLYKIDDQYIVLLRRSHICRTINELFDYHYCLMAYKRINGSDRKGEYSVEI